MKAEGGPDPEPVSEEECTDIIHIPDAPTQESDPPTQNT